MASPRAMKLFSSQVEEPDLQDLIKNISGNANDQIRAVLEFARSDVLTFLRGYTNVYRPPRYQRKFRLDATQRRVAVLPGDDDLRPAHPGGWADITKELRDSYYAQVNWVDGAWQLLIGNRDPDAVFVEAMDGFFVVQGIMDKTGPVARSIRKAVKALGLKNWSIASDIGAGAGEEGLLVGPKSGKNNNPPPDLSPWR